MAKRLSGSARRELVAAVRARYGASAPSVKREILREFSAITGYHRKSAIRILNGDGGESAVVVHRSRPRIYDEAFCRTLIVLWEASDRVCGKRLRALLPLLVPALERHGHLTVEPLARARLLGVSAATIDRLLAEAQQSASHPAEARVSVADAKCSATRIWRSRKRRSRRPVATHRRADQETAINQLS